MKKFSNSQKNSLNRNSGHKGKKFAAFSEFKAKFREGANRNPAKTNLKTKTDLKNIAKSHTKSFSIDFLEEKNQILISGKNSVIAAIKQNKRKIFAAYATSSTASEIKLQLTLEENHDFWRLLKIVDKAFIDEICDSNHNHQNLAIIASKLSFKSQFDLFSKLHISNDISELPNLLILDQLSDPQNVGAIVRSAVAFGFRDVLFCAHGSAKETTAMLKASVGASELAEFYILSNLNDTLSKLKKLGYWCVGLAGEGKSSFQEIAKMSPIALLVGCEGFGLRKLVKQNCDFLVRIEISPEIESLNASVAAAIAMHQISQKVI